MISRSPRNGVQRALAATALALAGCAAAARPAVEPMSLGSPEVTAGHTPDVPPADTSAGQESEAGAAAPAARTQDPEWENPFAQDRLLLYRLDVGSRRFISSSWDPVDDPLVIAVGLTYEPAYWPVGIETGASYSTADGILNGSGYRSTNFDFSFGLSKSFWPVSDKLLWTFGAGLAMNFTNERVNIFTPPATNQGFRGNDRWIAGYLHTRLGWKFSETFDVGVDLRGMTGQDVSTIGPVKSSDNYQVLVGIGIHR